MIISMPILIWEYLIKILLRYENEEKPKDKKRRRKRAILVKDQKQGKDIPLDEALEKGLVTADQAVYLKKAILDQ